MVDYRELFGVSELAVETNDGDGVKVAVLDTGVPSLEDIIIYQSENMTTERSKDSGHATFISSILFGRSSIIGLCRHASACFIKVFDGLFSSPDTVSRAIRHAIDAWGVDIINLSLGFSRNSPCPESLKKACKYAYKKGVTIVASSGNDGGQAMWPAALPGVICVGSAEGETRAMYSNTGEVDFVVEGTDLQGYDTDGNIIRKSGTSFSTAVIVGMLALLAAKHKREGKKITPSQLKQELIDNCKDIHDYGYDSETGYGIPFGHRSIQQNKNSLLLKVNSFYATIVKLVKKIVSHT